MRFFLRKYFITVISLYVTSLIFPAFKLPNNWSLFFYATGMYFLLSFLVKPLINILILPLQFLTFSLAGWIVEVFLFFIWTKIAQGIDVSAILVPPVQLGSVGIGSVHLVYWQSVIVAGILIKIIHMIVEWIID